MPEQTDIYRSPLSQADRRELQKTNRELIHRAFADLARKKWENDKSYTALTPDKKHQLSISLEATRVEISLSHPGKPEIAHRTWFTAYEWDEKGKKVIGFHITAQSKTEPAFEGNGFGSSLLELSNPILEKYLTDILEPLIENESSLRGLPIFSEIFESSEQKQTGRIGWTEGVGGKVLPNYSSDLQQVAKKLGFTPFNLQDGLSRIAILRKGK